MVVALVIFSAGLTLTLIQKRKDKDMTKIFEDKTELEATRAYHRVILKAAYDSFEEYPGAGDWGVSV